MLAVFVVPELYRAQTRGKSFTWKSQRKNVWDSYALVPTYTPTPSSFPWTLAHSGPADLLKFLHSHQASRSSYLLFLLPETFYSQIASGLTISFHSDNLFITKRSSSPDNLKWHFHHPSHFLSLFSVSFAFVSVPECYICILIQLLPWTPAS